MLKVKNIFLVICVLSLVACEDEEFINTCIDTSKIRTGACTFEFNPVCGCDGKTYGNACAADLSGVTKWTLGACN